MKITTNNHPRQLHCLINIPQVEQEWFDYIEGEDKFSLRMFRYKGEWYDSWDFTTTGPGPWSHGLPEAFRKWNGYASDTYWSGILIRLQYEDDQVVVGSYTE